MLIVGGSFTGVRAAAEFMGKGKCRADREEHPRRELGRQKRRLPALLSLSNGLAKFYQVDKHRKPVAEKDEF